ncbi:unnamed protein product [Symbiodinium sp. CCMP2592]|nr:unnamed protein product [Symbiodinium sp. CCMP2592]
MSKFKTPLDYYLHCLSAKLSGFTVAVAELVSAPLPEDRKRLWILGSAASDYTAQQWKEDVLALGELQLPRHHLRGFFKLYGQKASQAEQGGQDSSKPSWQLEQKYAASFSSSVEQAVNAGRLPKNFTPPPRHARPSLKWGAGLSPWAQANCDVYHEILTQMENDMIKEHGPLPRTPFPVADIGQSTFRGATSLSGLWGTMCTSSKLMRMDTWEILGGKGGLGVLGNNMTDKSVLGLSESELSSLAGNAMAFTQLARVLLPVLAQYLSK